MWRAKGRSDVFKKHGGTEKRKQGRIRRGSHQESHRHTLVTAPPSVSHVCVREEAEREQPRPPFFSFFLLCVGPHFFSFATAHADVCSLVSVRMSRSRAMVAGTVIAGVRSVCTFFFFFNFLACYSSIDATSLLFSFSYVFLPLPRQGFLFCFRASPTLSFFFFLFSPYCGERAAFLFYQNSSRYVRTLQSERKRKSGLWIASGTVRECALHEQWWRC